MQLDSTLRPDGPVAEQAADDPPLDLTPIDLESVGRYQVGDDAVVVTCKESNVVAAGFGDGPNHVECTVAVEGRNLDGGDALDLRKPPPESVRENAPANRWL